MGKGNFLKSRKLVKNTTILTVWFVIIALISSSSLSIELVDKSERNNFDFIIIEEEITFQKDTLTGLDPTLVEKNLKESSLENPMTQPSGPISEDGYFYACDAFSPYPVVRWELETGEGKETIATSGENQYFLSGGTYSCDEVWYACEYNSGGLWTIDPDDGSMENIGGGGTGLNSLAWDPVYNKLYGLGGGGLYEYDPETGEQEYIGPICQSVAMICMVIDNQGVAWAWDVKFSGNSTLYNINLETGECTEYCDMGQNLLYAQDGDIDRDTGIIWMCAYSSGGGFYAYWDWDACEIITICSLDSEYACAMIMHVR
jgi:hypothetical protein